MADLNAKEVVSKSKPFLTRKPNFAVIKSKGIDNASKSLDISADQMKRSKLLKDYNSKYDTYIRLKEPRSFDRSRQSLPSKALVDENSSLISTDFSHYELLRNLSASKCYSCVSRSGTTCDCAASDSATMSKREQIEKYFRSAEKWNKDVRCYDTTNNHF